MNNNSNVLITSIISGESAVSTISRANICSRCLLKITKLNSVSEAALITSQHLTQSYWNDPPLASRPSCLLISCHTKRRHKVESITFLQPPLENTEWPGRKRLSGAPGAINQLLLTQRWQGQALGLDCHSGFKPPTHWLTDTYCSQILDMR